jgi:hypothetical protein
MGVVRNLQFSFSSGVGCRIIKFVHVPLPTRLKKCKEALFNADKGRVFCFGLWGGMV